MGKLLRLAPAIALIALAASASPAEAAPPLTTGFTDTVFSTNMGGERPARFLLGGEQRAVADHLVNRDTAGPERRRQLIPSGVSADEEHRGAHPGGEHRVREHRSGPGVECDQTGWDPNRVEEVAERGGRGAGGGPRLLTGRRVHSVGLHPGRERLRRAG